jgi:hypothetical protein
MIRKAVFYIMVILNLLFLIWTYNTQVNILNELRINNSELVKLNETKHIFEKVYIDMPTLEGLLNG